MTAAAKGKGGEGGDMGSSAKVEDECVGLFRAAPPVRVKGKITVKTPNARSPRRQHSAFLTVNVAFPLRMELLSGMLFYE